MTLLHAEFDAVGLPKLKRHYAELSERLRQEAEARQRFRESLEHVADNAKVEFINGEALTQMPAENRHRHAIRNINRLVDTYVDLRRLGVVHMEQSLAEFPRNDFAPDICFWRKSKAKGFTEDQMIYPVPDFVAEVLSPSTERVDRGTKFRDHEANGVSEYWIVDPAARTIEQYLLRDGRYEVVGRLARGTVRSHAIKGFAMPVLAAFDDAANRLALRRLHSD